MHTSREFSPTRVLQYTVQVFFPFNSGDLISSIAMIENSAPPIYKVVVGENFSIEL